MRTDDVGTPAVLGKALGQARREGKRRVPPREVIVARTLLIVLKGAHRIVILNFNKFKLGAQDLEMINKKISCHQGLNLRHKEKAFYLSNYFFSFFVFLFPSFSDLELLFFLFFADPCFLCFSNNLEALKVKGQ